MDNPFRYDAAAYHEKVVHIARHVVSNDDALPTVAPRIDVECNSYHGAAIRKAEQERLGAQYPRLHR